MLRVGIELTTSVLKQAMIVHALDLTAMVSAVSITTAINQPRPGFVERGIRGKNCDKERTDLKLR
jgi:hypothetical protein